MYVDVGRSTLDGTQNVDVGVARVIGVNTTLQADLGCTALPGFFGAPTCAANNAANGAS